MKRMKITGRTVIEERVIPLYKREVMTGKDENGVTRSKIDVSDITGTKHLLDLSWLSQASKKLYISPDINDYIVVPVGIITSDVPNRNSQAFPLKGLVDFDTEQGCVRYKTFIGKPTFVEHCSDDIEQSKGVNFDSSLLPVKKYGIAKISILSGFDRTKDTRLCNAIIKGERNAYSMGATVSYFDCSVCGGILGPGVRRTCTCEGLTFEDLRNYGNIIKVDDVPTIQYLMAGDPVFVENSSVSSPADITAVSDIL